jgi:hypothetical protein
MMMHRKIIEQRETARQAGQIKFDEVLIVPDAYQLNNALLEMAETLQRFLPPQEQSLGTLNEKIEIFNTAKKITEAGRVNELLGQIPEETRVYLKEALGLDWAQVGKYLTVENLDKAIQQIEKQQRQIEIISAAVDQETLETLQKDLLPLYDKAATFLENQKNFRDKIELQASRAYINQNIAVKDLLKLSSQALPARQKYFIELTSDIEKVLSTENLLIVIYQNKKYLVCLDQDDLQLFNQAIVRAYLKIYENILVNDVLCYNSLGRGVSVQEQTDLSIGKATKKTIPDTRRQIKLFKELALLNYKYQDPNWQYFQKEAQKTLNAIKPSFKKKEFQELEEEINKEIEEWAKNNDLKTNLPTTESAAPEKRRAAVLPHIDLNVLQDSLRGLAGDPRAKRVLLVLLALLLLAGGGAGVMQLVKNRRTENSAEPESFFTRAVNTVREIFRNAGQKLSELFANPKKTPQELRTEGGQIIQEAKDTAENAIQSEGTNLTPEELSELRAEAQRAEALQTVTDTYLQAREKSDEVQAQGYDKSGYEAAGQTLADARAALENEAERQAEDDVIVRPLAEKLSSDLQEREKQIQTEIELQEQLAAEKAAKAAEEEARQLAAEKAQEQLINQTAELERELTRLRELYNIQSNKLSIISVIRNPSAFKSDYVEKAKAFRDLAGNNPEAYFTANGLRSLAKKIEHTRKMADEIQEFVENISAEANLNSNN